MAGGGIVSFKEGGQPPMYEQQFTTDFSRGANDRQAAFEDISSWVRNYQIEPEIADIVLNNPNSVAGDQINVLKQVLMGAGGRTLDEINEIVSSFASLQNRGNVNPRGERDFSRAEEPVEGRGLMALGQERAAQNQAAREAPLSDFQQSLVDAGEANVGQQLRNAERRMEYAERPQGLEGQRFSPGNRMPPKEVERRREEYRRSRPTQPRSQPMTPEEIAATRSQYGLGAGVAPQEPTAQEPTGSRDGEGYDFGALAEGLGITSLIDTAKQVGQDVFMGGYSGEEILDRTMPTRMEALREGRGLPDLDEYEQGAVGREALTFVPNYLRTVLFPNPENTRLGTATLGGVAEGIAPRAKGFLGMERDPDAEVAAEVIRSGPEEITAEAATIPDPDTTTPGSAPSPVSRSAIDEASAVARRTEDREQTQAAREGNIFEVGVDLSRTPPESSLFDKKLEQILNRSESPARTIATFLQGYGEGKMQGAGKALRAAEAAYDKQEMELLRLQQANRISQEDFRLKRQQIANDKEQLRITEANYIRTGDARKAYNDIMSTYYGDMIEAQTNRDTASLISTRAEIASDFRGNPVLHNDVIRQVAQQQAGGGLSVKQLDRYIERNGGKAAFMEAAESTFINDLFPGLSGLGRGRGAGAGPGIQIDQETSDLITQYTQ